MKTKKYSLFVQDAPSLSKPITKPRRKKIWRTELFRFLFKCIEALWMLLQILQSIYDFLKR